MDPVRCLISVLLIALPGVCSACSLGRIEERHPPSAQTQRGCASFYGRGSDGCKTASGERYQSNAYTAAHRKLPFGTKVCVKNLRNGRETIVRINDRGPFVKGRVIDVSEAAANKLGMTGSGVVAVEVVVMNDMGSPSVNH